MSPLFFSATAAEQENRKPMKLILPPTDIVSSILRKQEYRKGTNYRRSVYCVAVECPEGILLYNTLTGEMILEEKGDPQQLLVEHRFLVPADQNEKKTVEDTREIARLLQRQKSVVDHFTILTTTDCNARCFYCYELGLRRFSMTEDTAKAVVGHIAERCGGGPVKLSWFGGEPLLNQRVIDLICEGLLAKGIRYRSILTTNGFYLTQDAASRAKDLWHVTMAQITLDGTQKIYNETKLYADACNDPFERVLDNIEAALKLGINIGIRLNMDAKNADDLMDLAEVLKARFSIYSNVHVHVELLYEFTGRLNRFGPSEELVKRYLELIDKLYLYGLYQLPELRRQIKVNKCMADNDSTEVILPDGRIGKCEHVDEEDTIGSIFVDVRDEKSVAFWKQTVRFSECDNCPMDPLCLSLKKCDRTKGGCPPQVRMIWQERIRRQMLEAYDRHKKD